MEERTTGGRLEAAIFDLDGVITLTASAHAESWQRMFDEFMAKRSEETGEPFVPFDVDEDYLTYVDGRPRIEGVKTFLASRGIGLPEGEPSDAPVDRTAWGLGNRKDVYFQDVLEKRGVEVDARTVSFVRQLRQRGVRVAVASSSKNCGPILERAGLGDLFEVRVDGIVSEKLGLKGKPDPDIFVEAARRLDAAPARSIVVEDALSGVEAGRAGGFGVVVGVDRVGIGVSLREHGADWIVDGFGEDALDTVEAWLARGADRCLSALREWDRLTEELVGKRLAVFLDYDGTLTPIVSRPELAVLSDEGRSVLERVASRYPTAIISGRARDDVERLVGLPGLAYAGSHGFDIVGPCGGPVGHVVADWVEPVMKRVVNALKPQLAGIDGALIEEKRFSVAIHYRLVDEVLVPRIESIVDGVVASDMRLRKALGKKVFEVRPDLDWDKGKATLFLLEALGLDTPDIVPLYIGDDVTDEDAFAVVQHRGIGILVSEVPRPTKAAYWVQAPWEVYAVLERLIGLEGVG